MKAQIQNNQLYQHLFKISLLPKRDGKAQGWCIYAPLAGIHQKLSLIT